MTDSAATPGAGKRAAAKNGASRRRFLTGSAAAVAAGAATLAMPSVSRAQTVTIKMQGSWGQADVFNEFAQDYVRRVNEMAGARLRIDYLLAGAVVGAFDVQDGVHKGVIDAAHTVPVYWYGKNKAASLFGSGPINGTNANQTLAWIYYGGGLALYEELVQKILGLNIVGFFAMPMPTQPLGWFKKQITNLRDLQGLKYRTVGLAADLMQQFGVTVTQLPGGEIIPAMQRGVIDAFEFNNPTSDMRFGAQDVSKIYMMGSYHQAMEFFEIMFNKTVFDRLAPEQKAIVRYAAEAVSSANEWKSFDYYSRDLQDLINNKGVKVYRTPADVFEAQLKAWDTLSNDLNKDPYFKRVTDSQNTWAKRVVYYSLLNAADFKKGYEHKFGPLGI